MGVINKEQYDLQLLTRKTNTAIEFCQNPNNMSYVAQALKIEESFPYFSLNGAVCLVEGHHNDPGTFHGNPHIPCLIQCDQGFTLHIKWQTRGKMANFLCGKWKVDILTEKWGKDETCLPEPYNQKEVEWDCDGNYHCKITVPPNTMEEGLYKFAVCVTMCSTCGKNIPAPIAGFVELPAIKFYKG